MVKILVEIQASHVGIGKSTSGKEFNKPWVDDCIQLPANWDLTGLLSQVEVPLYRVFQFASQDVNWKPMLNYYKRRLKHLGVDAVLVLDYGNNIQNNEEAVQMGFKRMWVLGRKFEWEAFNTYEHYKSFFQRAEQIKSDVVEAMKKDKFFHYKEVSTL
ncbi:uncharacterized protein TNCT_360691 [Trichonephila clavata]|uniref:Uncharacterized protein n=1 Tax=Trichonephila clavata TaxID=2740835 RepID=A0A8X6F791_TRICU|nr:uncharacterized protein TNCT_360691 [Trichonephila clavata]